ncbi:MAG TPA: hypothetical protein VKB92_14110 [Myxococcales bacterium]|nr:hypothetical protein [Myxococcales bacterium]
MLATVIESWIKYVSVIAIRKHLATPAERPIYRPGDANAQALHSARERTAVLYFRNEMQVVRLDRKVRQPEPEPLASRRQRGSDGAEALPHADGDVHRMPRLHRSPRAVWYPCSGLLRPTCTLAVSASPTVPELHRRLSACPPH